jgi:hypothetical protein
MRPLLNGTIVAQDSMRSKATVSARSIGSHALEVLQSGAAGRVLACFSRVCDLATDDGAVVALGTSGVERGPLTVVLNPTPTGIPWAGLPASAPFRAWPGRLALQGHRHSTVWIDLSQAVRWEARPGWDALRSRRREIASAVQHLDGSAALDQLPGTVTRWADSLGHATEAVRAAYGRRDRQELMAALTALCGLGEGLTPQGDDWLAGWLLALHLADPPDSDCWAVEALGADILHAASGRSTLLSRALLAAAVAGEASESWHDLLHEMARFPADAHRLEQAVRPILALGATSGAAMLLGFLVGLEKAVQPAPGTRGNGTR